MDSSCALLLSALREMETRLCERLARRSTPPTRCAARFGQHTTVYADDATMYAVDLEPSYDDLGGGPVFDDLGRTVFDDFDSGPVFDADPDDFNDHSVFDQEPGVLSTACVGTGLDEDPLFDDKPRVDTESRPDQVVVLKFKSAYDVELSIFDEEPSVDPIFDTAPDSDLADGPVFDTNPTAVPELVLGSNIAAPTTTMDKHFTRSIIFSNRTGKGLNRYCSSRVDREELFHEDSGSLVFSHVHGATTVPMLEMRSVLCGTVVAADGYAHHLWGPGASEGWRSTRIGFVCGPEHHIDFHLGRFESKPWDPGASDCSRFARFGVDFGSCADYHWDP